MSIMEKDISYDALIAVGKCYAVQKKKDVDWCGCIEDEIIKKVKDAQNFLFSQNHPIFGTQKAGDKDKIHWGREKQYATVYIEGNKFFADIIFCYAESVNAVAIITALYSGEQKKQYLKGNDIIHIYKSFHGNTTKEVVVDNVVDVVLSKDKQKNDNKSTIKDIIDTFKYQEIDNIFKNIRWIDIPPVDFRCVEIHGCKEFHYEGQCGNKIGQKHSCEDHYYEMTNPCSAAFIEKYPLQLYGILSGDEGWPFVSKPVAISRLNSYWRTRKFHALVPFGKSILTLNFKFGKNKYIPYQKALFQKYNMNENKYSTMKSTIACLDHGGFLLLLDVLLRLPQADYLSKEFDEAHNKYCYLDTFVLRKACRKVRELKIKLVRHLRIIEYGNIYELNAVKTEIIKQVGLFEYIESTRQTIDYIDSLIFQQEARNQFRVMCFLTAIGLIGVLPVIHKSLYPWIREFSINSVTMLQELLTGIQ